MDSKEKLKKELKDLDYGVCNPYKSQRSNERADEIKKELRVIDSDDVEHIMGYED